MKLINHILDVFSLIFVPMFFYESIKLYFFDMGFNIGINILFYLLGGCMIIAGFYFIFKGIRFFKKLIQCWLLR